MTFSTQEEREWINVDLRGPVLARATPSRWPEVSTCDRGTPLEPARSVTSVNSVTYI